MVGSDVRRSAAGCLPVTSRVPVPVDPLGLWPPPVAPPGPPADPPAPPLLPPAVPPPGALDGDGDGGAGNDTDCDAEADELTKPPEPGEVGRRATSVNEWVVPRAVDPKSTLTPQFVESQTESASTPPGVT